MHKIGLICQTYPGHKNLSWLSGVERIQAHSLFKQELFSFAGVEIDVAGAPGDHQPNAQSTGIGSLEAFFDSMHVQVLDVQNICSKFFMCVYVCVCACMCVANFERL